MRQRAVVYQLGNDIPSGIAQIKLEQELDYRPEANVLKDGDILVEIRAAAINFPDLLMTHGGYQHKPQLPFVPGTEASGIVKRVGKSVTRFKKGDFVICGGRSGMMQSHVIVPEFACSEMPDGLSFPQAAAFNVAYTTAYHCLVERANITKDDSVLINGATGGVGSAAVEVARAIGCKTIIGTGTSREKMQVVTSLGATNVIDFSETDVDKLPEIVKGITGGGVDVVYDPVGGKVFEKSLASTAWGARVAIVGWASGVQPSVRTNYALIKGLTILGCRAGESVRRGFVDQERRMGTLFRWIKEGKLKPHVSNTFDIKSIHEGFRCVLQRKVVGKAVITFENESIAKL